MKKSFLITTLFIFQGCADLAENPTDASNFVTVPLQVQSIIDGNCSFCHIPESGVVLKGQKPFFRNYLPDSSATFLDTVQIWQSRKRIAFRVQEGTMPRSSDTSEVFSPMMGPPVDIIVEWAE